MPDPIAANDDGPGIARARRVVQILAPVVIALSVWFAWWFFS